MRVSLLREKSIENIILPNQVVGNFWITDKDVNGIEKNLISIEGQNDKWMLVSNSEASLVSNDMVVPSAELIPENFYVINKIHQNSNLMIYCSKISEVYKNLEVTSLLNQGIKVGKSNCLINFSLLKGDTVLIKEENSKIYLNVIDNTQFIYVNNVRILDKVELKLSDIIFINGLKIILIKYENKLYLKVNNPMMQVSFSVLDIPILRNKSFDSFDEPSEEQELILYNEDDYFHKMPRFYSEITPIELSVDAPPQKKEEQAQSILLTVGPMLTMSMTSLITGYTSVSSVLNGNNTWSSAIPSLVVCGAMIASTIIWPIFTKSYQKLQDVKNEKMRQKKYQKYIEEKKEIIRKGIKEQTVILKNNYPTTKDCEQIILNKYVSLWQRRIEDKDFLTLHLGIGNIPMKINIHYPEDHFTMAEDNLKEMVSNLGNEPKLLTGAPISYSLIENQISGIIGSFAHGSEFIKRLIIQISALHSYDNVKIVVLTTEENQYKWKFLKSLPHSFSDDKQMRFFATNNDEYKEICYYLDRVISKRLELLEKNAFKAEELKQHFIIITDNFKRIRNYDVIDKILDNKKYLGFMMMILDSKVTNLPDQCKSFINISEQKGEIQSSNMSENQKFELDISIPIDFDLCSRTLANIPIEIDSEDEGNLPNKVGFLEMYDIGKVEQLNSITRWSNHNPILRLEAPVGYGKNGELISIDLHEKYHGPHGLIAGMTGSGKSEFIITYILSMAVNYHPYEVQFILIDYKGGGLAGAFENQTNNIKLPHLVGTITNLDENEIKRSLASIESELKRRQSLFNEAREISGESTVDIYEYQKMFRENIVKEPISHLFIICDEFAELKTQQPQFMEQLISTARIGRSLGVHLILATQKPSGVVDPQIWSNSRFRICMKVQEKSDSNEVIKCPDAAFLKQTGRFYFQVGYNEVFTLGQAAWAGGKYFPNEKVVKNIDSSINIINNIGYVVKNIETKEKQENVISKGEELNNIVKYLADLAVSQNIKCRPLWLEKIPEFIKVDTLAKKYNYQKEQLIINPIIGEYDIPNRQEQNLLTLPLSKEGNSLIYGAGGSGKENFITTAIYSSMIYYKPEELNFYILDFGSGALKVFRESPLVGDILTMDDDDKITNLFKMLNEMIEERKKLFQDYNGDYFNYCKNSGNIVPSVVVVINNYETFQENNEKYDDDLSTLTRECNRYGIYFIITLATPNGMRFKLKQNFSLIYSLQQNNDDDYTTVLGNVHKTYPAKIFGRGIVRKDDVYEFQTALVAEKDEIPSYIKAYSKDLSNKYDTRAKSIPTLPEIVTYSTISNEMGKDNKFIIGIEKNSLAINKFDFIKNYITIISGIELGYTTTLVNSLLNQILLLRYNITVINADEYDFEDKYKTLYNYIDSDFNNIFEQKLNKILECYEQYKNNNFNNNIFSDQQKEICFIVGVNSFKNKLSEENKIKYGELYEKAKELGIISFILIDSIDQFKKTELDTWFKNTVNLNNGIWVGNGISDQYTLKINNKVDEMKDEVPNDFCFVINRGKPTYVKYVSSINIKINDE